MAITDSISPLDDGFMRLGHVATLMAEENEHRAYEDIMDRFKRAVFAGEFEPPHIFTPDRDNIGLLAAHGDRDPPVRTDAGAGRAGAASKRFYGVGRETIVSVLYTSDALPGKAEQWSELIDPRGHLHAGRSALRAGGHPVPRVTRPRAARVRGACRA